MSDPIKFSFAKPATNGITKKPVVKEETHDYIKGFSHNEIISVEEKSNKSGGPLIIPLEEQSRTKRSKPQTGHNENKNSTSTIIRDTTIPKTLDELAAEEVIRKAMDLGKPTEADTRVVPLTVQNQIEGMEDIIDEDERFKYDLESRPDEANAEAYEDMPIEDFGQAMLRGMGWTPGTSIGLNNKGLAEPIEFVKRPGYRTGLGATPKDIPVKKKKYIKPGESRDAPPVMVAPTGPDGKVRHVKGISEKLVPLKKGLAPGDLVSIVSGPHEGLYARIVNEGDEDELVLRLQSSSEYVTVSKSDVSIVDLKKLSEGHPALKFMLKDKERERDERDEKDTSSYSKKDKERRHESSSSKHSSKSSRTSSKDDDSSSSKSWLRPNILVRVVSKSFENGKYYNKKVRIIDVVGHNKCTVILDSGSVVEGVKQRMLETVIPQQGGKVMVVEGVNKGKIARILEKKSGKEECVVVQMLGGDLSVETFPMDSVAQYVGSVEEEAVDISV